MPYSTSDLNTIITALEKGLGKSYAEVSHEGERLVYRSTAEILQALGYFKSLLGTATDAPTATTPEKRTFYLYGGGGR